MNSLQSVSEAPLSPEKFITPEVWKKNWADVKEELEKKRAFSPSYYKVRPYEHSFCLRVCVVVGVAIAALVYLSAMMISRILFPSWPVGIAIGVLVLGIVGSGFFVLKSLSRKRDILAGDCIDLFAPRKWLSINLFRFREKSQDVNKGFFFSSTHIDLSTLDESESGIALGYYYMPFMEVRMMHSMFQVIAVPVEVICRVVYHLFRILVAPIYIVFQLILQKIEKRDGFSLSDIKKEVLYSIVSICKAPAYGAAHLISLAYSFLDPLGGRVWISRVERGWNDDIIRSRGIWLIYPEKNFVFEGGGGKGNLGKHSFYLMGCLQPNGVFLFKNGRVVSAVSPSMQAFPWKEAPVYPIFD